MGTLKNMGLETWVGMWAPAYSATSSWALLSKSTSNTKNGTREVKVHPGPLKGLSNQEPGSGKLLLCAPGTSTHCKGILELFQSILSHFISPRSSGTGTITPDIPVREQRPPRQRGKAPCSGQGREGEICLRSHSRSRTGPGAPGSALSPSTAASPYPLEDLYPRVFSSRCSPGHDNHS